MDPGGNKFDPILRINSDSDTIIEKIGSVSDVIKLLGKFFSIQLVNFMIILDLDVETKTGSGSDATDLNQSFSKYMIRIPSMLH